MGLQQIVQWNTKNLKTETTLVHQMFQDIAKNQPHSQAIDAWDGQMTYQQLDQVSTKLAIRLQNAGVEAGSWVLLCFHKSRWAIISMLAVLKAGAAFVPVDPRFPAHRIKQILETTEAKLRGHRCSRHRRAVKVIGPKAAGSGRKRH